MKRKIFVFGESGSGKSTMIAALLAYISERVKESYGSVIGRVHFSEQNRSERFIEILKCADENRIPKPTRVDGDPLDLSFGYEEPELRKGVFFNFIDYAGESVQRLSTLSTEYGIDVADVRNRVKESNNVIICCRAQAESLSKRMCQSILELLIRDKMKVSLCLLITQSDTFASNNWNEEVQKKFMLLVNYLPKFQSGSCAIPYSVGEITEQSDDRGTIEKTVKWNFEKGTKKLFNWLVNNGIE